MPAIERRHAAIGLTDGQAVQRQRVGEVSRVRRHRVAQHDTGRRNDTVVVDGDRVAQHVARIDDAGRAVVDLAAPRASRRTSAARLPTMSRVGSFDDRRRRIVRRIVDRCRPRTALTKPWFEIMVPSTTSASTMTSKVIVATLLVVSDCVGAHDTGRRILRRIDRTCR